MIKFINYICFFCPRFLLQNVFHGSNNCIYSGVWTIGNIGREQGSIWIALCSAYLLYPTLTYIGDDNMWVFLMVVAASLSFDTFSKQWRLKPRKRKNIIQRIFYLGLAAALYTFLLGSYLCFNAVVTDSEGEEIKLSEAIQHFLTSPIWLDLKVNLIILN